MALNAKQTRRLAQMVQDILELSILDRSQQRESNANSELLELIQMSEPDLVTMIDGYLVKLSARVATRTAAAQAHLDSLAAEAAEINAELGRGSE